MILSRVDLKVFLVMLQLTGSVSAQVRHVAAPVPSLFSSVASEPFMVVDNPYACFTAGDVLYFPIGLSVALI